MLPRPEKTRQLECGLLRSGVQRKVLPVDIPQEGAYAPVELSTEKTWLLARRVLQGHLDLIVLQTFIAWARCTATASPSASSRFRGSAQAEPGTLYPALLRLEQRDGFLQKWGASENNRKAKYYSLTRAGAQTITRRDRELGAHDRADGTPSRGTEGPEMEWLRIFGARLRGLFRKRQLDVDLDAELRSHLEMLTEENIRRGMSPVEARYGRAAVSSAESNRPKSCTRTAKHPVFRRAAARLAICSPRVEKTPGIRDGRDPHFLDWGSGLPRRSSAWSTAFFSGAFPIPMTIGWSVLVIRLHSKRMSSCSVRITSTGRKRRLRSST